MASAFTPRRSSPRWFQVARFHKNELPGINSALCVPAVAVMVVGHERPEVWRGNQNQVPHQGGSRWSGCLAGLQSCQVRPGDQPAHTERHQVYLGHLIAIVVLDGVEESAQIVA